MADFFEDLGKRITEVASDIGKATEDTIEVQKIKSNIRSLKRANERDLMDIGRMVYEKFGKNEVTETDCIALCESVEKREEEIEKKEDEAKRIKEGI